MQPHNPQSNRGLNIPSRGDNTPHLTPPQRQAAANVLRHHIERIYQTDPPNQPAPEPVNEPAPTEQNPYHRTHDPEVSAQNWQQYHSAWQQYYQQYYHRYYAGQLHAQRQQMQAERAKHEAERHIDTTPQTVVGGASPDEEPKKRSRPPKPVDAVKDELLEKISERGKKLRRSRHFMPIISAIVVGLLFLAVQYNRLIVAQVMAYVSPGSAESQNIILDPTTNTKVSNDPRLVIPKINVDVPVVYTLTSLDNAPVQDALRGGVVHYPIPGANSVPGQAGNTVILGHSSNDVFDPGAYKFAFVLLDRLDKGDTFYLNYQGTRYTYSVTDKRIIEPNQVSSLVLNTTKPMASLVTCTPAGTALHRLVIFAEQVSPDPSKVQGAPSGQQNNKPVDIPGNSPTILERLFGG